MKHTPGTWEVRESCEPTSAGWNDPKCLVLVNGELLATLAFMDDGSHSANAYLISAAPELLAVLKSFPYFPAECTHGDPSWHCASCHSEWERALAAWSTQRKAVVAKAEGLEKGPKE